MGYYESSLPDHPPLTPAQSADLLARLGGDDDRQVREQIFAGHVAMLRKLVHQALDKGARDGEELEAIGYTAMWNAILKLEPREPGYFPFEYLRIHTWGAIHRASNEDAEDDTNTVSISDLGDDDDDWHPPDLGGKNAAVNRQRSHVADVLPRVDVPRFTELWELKAAGTSWKDISAMLGEPATTLSSRFERGAKILQKIISEESR